MRFWKYVILISASICVVAVIMISRSDRSKSRIPKAPPRGQVVVEERHVNRPRIHRIPRREEGIWGRVLDAEGNGVSGATVEAGVFEGDSDDCLTQKVLVRRTVTDSSGVFRFPKGNTPSSPEDLFESSGKISDWLGSGCKTLLVASKAGYVAGRREVDLHSPGGPHEIVLREIPGVSGRVIWKETEDPVALVHVVCTPERSDIYEASRAICQTDEEGLFNLRIPARGAARIETWFRNPHEQWYVLEPGQARIELVPGETIAGLTLAISRGSATLIEGRVLSVEGNAVAGATVALSTDKAVSDSVTSAQDGSYRLLVPKEWPYQSYFVDDWPERPEIFQIGSGSSVLVMPKTEAKEQRFSAAIQGYAPDEEELRMLQTEIYHIYLEQRQYGKQRWEWPAQWTPPPHAPPERLVAFHPEYEIGIAEVPCLGIGQVRRGVVIVLHKGSRVSGKVVDDNSEPVERAKIEIRVVPGSSPLLIGNDNNFITSREFVCDEDGRFEMRFLREGSYEITASHNDCDPLTQPLGLGRHRVIEGFDFVLVKRKGFIRGKVLDERGNPWPHATVRAGTRAVLGVGGRYLAEISQDGSYEFSQMAPGKYNLWLEVRPDYPAPQGILWASVLREIPVGTEGANITVMELPAGALRVCVVDHKKQPMEKFRFQCYPLKLREGVSAIFMGFAKGETSVPYRRQFYNRFYKYAGVLRMQGDVVSKSGEFVADRIAPGKYSLSVKAENCRQGFAEVEIEAGRETGVFLVLEEAHAGTSDEKAIPMNAEERRVRERHRYQEQVTLELCMFELEEAMRNRESTARGAGSM